MPLPLLVSEKENSPNLGVGEMHAAPSISGSLNDMNQAGGLLRHAASEAAIQARHEAVIEAAQNAAIRKGTVERLGNDYDDMVDQMQKDLREKHVAAGRPDIYKQELYAGQQNLITFFKDTYAGNDKLLGAQIEDTLGERTHTRNRALNTEVNALIKDQATALVKDNKERMLRADGSKESVERYVASLRSGALSMSQAELDIAEREAVDELALRKKDAAIVKGEVPNYEAIAKPGDRLKAEEEYNKFHKERGLAGADAIIAHATSQDVPVSRFQIQMAAISGMHADGLKKLVDASGKDEATRWHNGRALLESQIDMRHESFGDPIRAAQYVKGMADSGRIDPKDYHEVMNYYHAALARDNQAAKEVREQKDKEAKTATDKTDFDLMQASHEGKITATEFAKQVRVQVGVPGGLTAARATEMIHLDGLLRLKEGPDSIVELGHVKALLLYNANAVSDLEIRGNPLLGQKFTREALLYKRSEQLKQQDAHHWTQRPEFKQVEKYLAVRYGADNPLKVLANDEKIQWAAAMKYLHEQVDPAGPVKAVPNYALGDDILQRIPPPALGAARTNPPNDEEITAMWKRYKQGNPLPTDSQPGVLMQDIEAMRQRAARSQQPRVKPPKEKP